jgi:two-component system chemotaxis sensor kinase CheA
MVRNAIGHGIETAEERKRAGKSPQGTIQLNAYHQGNQVVIEVSDDGSGIDMEKVRQRAVSQGLFTADELERLTEAEMLNLVFRPGFSTAAEVTEVSGRGVGLDVVRSVLDRLKGTVQTETEVGRGTTFLLRLPLTLAIIKALLFQVEGRLYAIPLNAVAQITRTSEDEIHQVEHFDVLQLRNEVLPLLRLGAAREPGPESAHHKVFVLVIKTGDRKFGLVVDGLVGEEELVIKAIDDQQIETDLISGASILGDGRVVLILNLTALADRFTSQRADTANRIAGLLSGLGGVFQARSVAGGQA